MGCTRGDIRFRVPALEEAEGALEGLNNLQAEIVDSILSRVRRHEQRGIDPDGIKVHSVVK